MMASRKLFKKSFDAGKCKTSLKLATSRIRLLRNKRQEQLKVYKRNLAQLLQSGDVQTARTRVEHVFREDNTVAAYDLIESYCEQIVARLPIIESQKTCPLDLEEAISSIVFAASRCADLVELADIRRHFAGKYGKDFISASVELRAGCHVNCIVVEKLSAKIPGAATKLKILAAIAKEHNVNWDPGAVEEQVLEISEEKLAGPTGFMRATDLSPELPTVPKHTPGSKVMDDDTSRNPQASRKTHDSHFPMNVPTVDDLKDDASSEVGSRTPGVMSAPNPGTSKPNSSIGTESRTAGPVIDSQGKEESVPLERSSWNMHFKDATSAAQAAAVSAERASIAARAAAELSSLERMSRQNSAESCESPHGNRANASVELPFSKTYESFPEGPVKNERLPKSFHATEATSHRQGEVSYEHNPQPTERREYDDGRHLSRPDRSRSSWSAVAFDDDVPAVASTQKTDAHSPSHAHERRTSKIKSHNDESEKPNHGERSSTKGSEVSYSNDSETRRGVRMEKTGRASEREDLDGEGSVDVRSRQSYLSESSFSVSWTQNPLNSVSGTTNIRSSISPHGVGRGNSERETLEPTSADECPKFDTDEESDSCLVEAEAVESKSDSYVLNAGEASSSNPWKSKQSGNETMKIVASRVSSSSSKRSTSVDIPDTSFDSFPAFDDTDVSSEEETNNVIPNEGNRRRVPSVAQNISSTRVGAPSSGRVLLESIESPHRSRNGEGRIDKMKLSTLDGPEYESDPDDSFVLNSKQKNSSHGGKGFVQTSERTAKGQRLVSSSQAFPEQIDYLDQVSIVTETGGPKSSVDSGSEGLSSLNFEFSKFGGLRNKVYSRPPYVRHPSSKHSGDVDTQDDAKPFGTDETSSSLKEHQKASKWTKTGCLRPSDDNIDLLSNESNDSYGNVLQRKKEQDAGPSYRSTLSGDQWQWNISGSDHEVSDSSGSDIRRKGRFGELDSASQAWEKGKGDISGSTKPSEFKAYRGQKTSKQETAYEVQTDSDGDEPVEHTTLNLGENSRCIRRSGSSEENPVSQACGKSKSAALDEISDVRQRRKEQDANNSYRSKLQWQSNISGSDHEVSASFGSNVRKKSRLPEEDSFSQARERGKPEAQGDVSGSTRTSQFKAYGGQKTSKQETVYEMRTEQKRSAFSNYDSDSDEPIDVLTALNLGENSRRCRRGGFSPENPVSQACEKPKSVTLDEGTSYNYFEPGRNPSRPDPVSELQTDPKRGTSDNYSDPSSDEPSDDRTTVNPKVNSRLRGSVRTQSRATPFSHSNAHSNLRNGPLNSASSLDSVTEETLPTKSIPVTTPRVDAVSGRIKDIKQSGSEIIEEDVKPSQSKRTVEPQKAETRTSRTPYDPVVSNRDEPTDIRKEVWPNMVGEHDKSGTSDGTAAQHVLGAQATERDGSRFSGNLKVLDAEYSNGGLRSRRAEPRTKSEEQAKTVPQDVIADDSRTEDKTAGTKKTSASVETASPRAPHVHPKLPDYDSIFAQFGRRQR